MKNPNCVIIIGNIQGAINPLYKPNKKVCPRLCQQTFGKNRPRRRKYNRRQPDFLREPFRRSAPMRSKLKLSPRTVTGPANTVVHTESNAKIFSTGKPRESSWVNETKRMHSQSNKDRGQSTNWRNIPASSYQGFLLPGKFSNIDTPT